ncbi:hypothetical protein [Rhizobacter sp. Root1221]|uniref:AbiTii domain-containing protein n=1 Tax=Rhizobacter sp. Root1221 TaxID=1736433 RepID=UPI0006FB5250|nr:hypothetical protein [Rhizobacter sp. Root1221]KQV99954.1 hypothetical protein ASC87_19835 [Rhizobacter sp. Root1221]
MSLLREITEAAIAKDADVARLLRLCLVLAQRVDYRPLLDWVTWELKGYPAGVPVPDYRHVSMVNRGLIAGYWSGQIDLPTYQIPEEIRGKLLIHEFRDGISELQHLVTNASKSGTLTIPWPMEFMFKHTQNIVRGAQVTKAWSELSLSAVAGVVDQVVNRILEFTLTLERTHPEAGNLVGFAQTPPEATLTQNFNSTFNGAVQNYSAGGNQVSQTAYSVAPGDLDGLIAALRGAGVGQADSDELKRAIEADKQSGSNGLGASAGGWLAGFTAKAAQGVAAATVSKLVLAYFGGV